MNGAACGNCSRASVGLAWLRRTSCLNGAACGNCSGASVGRSSPRPVVSIHGVATRLQVRVIASTGKVAAIRRNSTAIRNRFPLSIKDTGDVGHVAYPVKNKINGRLIFFGVKSFTAPALVRTCNVCREGPSVHCEVKHLRVVMVPQAVVVMSFCQSKRNGTSANVQSCGVSRSGGV